MPLRPQLHGYLLAGGQSSRMGTDKALVSFGASTLLDRAAACLAATCDELTLLGPARPTHPHLHAIPDRIAFAGPLAGIESALTHLVAHHGLWALFLPVDVPLLPPGLLRALVSHWLAQPHTRLAFPITAGRAQPVISLVHATALPGISRALADNQRRLRAALELTAADLAPQLNCPTQQVLRTPTLTLEGTTLFADQDSLPWQPTSQELACSDLWFANANTPAELHHLRRAAATQLPY